MANNYLQYSTNYDFPRKVSEEESDKILQIIMKAGAEEYSSVYDEEIDEDTPLEDQYIGTSLDMENSGVWFYAEESGEPNVVIAMIQALQEYFKDEETHAFSWAYSCSKMRVDEFGGGAAAIKRGKDPTFVDALSYVLNEMEKAS
jgi:hypothetical protein